MTMTGETPNRKLGTGNSKRVLVGLARHAGTHTVVAAVVVVVVVAFANDPQDEVPVVAPGSLAPPPPPPRANGAGRDERPPLQAGRARRAVGEQGPSIARACVYLFVLFAERSSNGTESGRQRSCCC